MTSTMFDGMFKQVPDGLCKISFDGQIAVKTSTGYKTFDAKKNKLTNCDNFAFDVNGMFWVVPTFKVAEGEIILVNKTPRYVLSVGDKSIKVFSYENSTIEEIVPEHHVFMGKTYCYGKIFSPFANMSKTDTGMNDMMKMMMMSSMFGGNSTTSGFGGMNGMNPMMLMMLGGNTGMFENMFDGAFDFGTSTKEEGDE